MTDAFKAPVNSTKQKANRKGKLEGRLIDISLGCKCESGLKKCEDFLEGRYRGADALDTGSNSAGHRDESRRGSLERLRHDALPTGEGRVAQALVPAPSRLDPSRRSFRRWTTGDTQKIIFTLANIFRMESPT